MGRGCTCVERLEGIGGIAAISVLPKAFIHEDGDIAGASDIAAALDGAEQGGRKVEKEKESEEEN